MSSWLLGAAAGAGLAGGGAGATAAGLGGGRLAPRQWRTEECRSSPAASPAGAAAAGFSGFARAAGAAAFSATGGFASSSAMMRRIDAKISSIEGSWTFAGCVISELHIINALAAFYTKQDGDLPVPDMQAGIYHRSSLTCPQIKASRNRREPCPCSGHPSVACPQKYQMRRESLCCLEQAYVRPTIDCKQRPARDSSEPAFARQPRGIDQTIARASVMCSTDRPARSARVGRSGHRHLPSGVRTPTQLSRTC